MRLCRLESLSSRPHPDVDRSPYFHPGQNQLLAGTGEKYTNQIEYCLNHPPSPATRYFGAEFACQNAYRVICYGLTCSARHKYGNRIPISRRLPAGSFLPLYFALLTLSHTSSTWIAAVKLFLRCTTPVRCLTAAAVASIPENGSCETATKK